MGILGNLGRRRVSVFIGIPIVLACGYAGYRLAAMETGPAPRSQALFAADQSATGGEAKGVAATSAERPQTRPLGSDALPADQAAHAGPAAASPPPDRGSGPDQVREGGLQTGSIDGPTPPAPRPRPQARNAPGKSAEQAKPAPGLVQGAARALEPVPLVGPLLSPFR